METEICALEALLRLGDRVCDDPPIVQVQQYPSPEWVVSLHAKPGQPACVEGRAKTFNLAALECLKKLALVVGDRARGDLASLVEMSMPLMLLEKVKVEGDLRAVQGAASLLEIEGGKP
jgi:hypothetical protein